jgi:hypothetical protein
MSVQLLARGSLGKTRNRSFTIHPCQKSPAAKIPLSICVHRPCNHLSKNWSHYYRNYLSIGYRAYRSPHCVGPAIFLTGLNWDGQDCASSSAPAISTLILGIASFVAFFLWETFGAKCPMFPSRLADNLNLFAAIYMLCLAFGINYIPVR